MSTRHSPQIASPSRPNLPTDPATVDHWILLGFILLLAFVVRARDLNFATAYMDESIYVNYGRMFLSGHYQWPLDHPLRWTWGWYLWPAMAAIADWGGSLAGVRALAAVLGVVTVGGVFAFAKRLFSPGTGLGSALVFALLAPAVFSSRIATRDCASVPFLALGLWAYAAAWKDNRTLQWLACAAGLMAAFLCKYLVAIFFPVLLLLALRKGWKPVLALALPLAVACAIYGYVYRGDLAHLLSYGQQYQQLKITDPQLLWRNYVSGRADVWIVAALALIGTLFLIRKHGWTVFLMWLCVAAFAFFQYSTRADYDYWKHAAYPLLFLTPLAIAGLLVAARRWLRVPLARTALVVVLALGLAWAGHAWNMDQFVFWPDVSPALAYFDGRLTSSTRILADDSVFSYYFQPPLDLAHVTGPFAFVYRGQELEPAYRAAVSDGYFDFLIFDGAPSGEAAHLRSAVQAVIAQRYDLRLRTIDGVLGHDVEIYERRTPPAVEATAPTEPKVEIVRPKTGEPVRTAETVLAAKIAGAQKGWYALVDVYTRRWYPQGDKIAIDPASGSFIQTIYLGGQGKQRCHHLVRVQLFDSEGKRQAVATEFNIERIDSGVASAGCS